MQSGNSGYFLRLGLIIVAVLVLVAGGGYYILNFVTPNSQDIPPAISPTFAVAIITPTPKSTPTPTATATRKPSTATAIPDIPPGGIVYVLSPNINSVGWVQEGETGNHFSESFMYTGVKDGTLHHGAMQFDLSFITEGSTIFMAELELTGLEDKALTTSNEFELNILTTDIDEDWSRHNFNTIHNAEIDETLTPLLKANNLAKGVPNTLEFNAAQRSIIEKRLETDAISFRLDSLYPEGWFAWDSGYGPDTLGQSPKLRLGVLPPAATDELAKAPPNSTPTPTPTFIIVTSTPSPENVLTAAAIAPAQTYEATTTGTPTPVPGNWVTPWLITSTPSPENAATAQYQVAEATAIVIAYGTTTPLPVNMATGTPTATATQTPIFIMLEGNLPPLTPTPTASITPMPTPTIPPELIGKIAFKSDRTGKEEIYVVNPDGTGMALLTARWPYNVADLADVFSLDGRFRVFTKDTTQYINDAQGVGHGVTVPAVFWYDSLYGAEEQVTHFGAGIAWNGVWSPAKEQIALVSNESSDDEIWVVNKDGSELKRITETNEENNAREIGKDTFFAELNGDPSWSPDGSQIVFWSNRNGNNKIWVMNADGSNLYTLSTSDYSDWAPVWIKYPGVPDNALQTHMPYIGPFDPFGADRECTHFTTATEAQAFYLAAGGPAVDLHGLDDDQDGTACN